MNKVVCYVCGTSYPENATQCPICGYVQTAENTSSENSGENGYTYVKGGRFSKSNVKKRNQAVNPMQKKAAHKKKNNSKSKDNANVLSIILIVVLTLAILSVAGYIALRFFVPNDFLFEGLGNLKLSAPKLDATEPVSEATATPETEVVEEVTVSLDCTAITLDTDIVHIKSMDVTYQLLVTLDPVETLDSVSYVSSDETVVTVNNEGMIIPVGRGTAFVTVACGKVSAQCTVNCDIPEEFVLELNRKEITFDTEGQTWALYNGEIPAEDIVWSSDDSNVATIEGGKVTAVANGDTTVYAVYNDQTVACAIHCKFEDKQEETSNITEADGTSSKTYMLYNPHGYADDVTINTGDQFVLKLVDSNMENAENVQWSVKDENVCKFSENTVTGTGFGVTEVTATCDGKSYTCVVRVN